MTNDIDASRLPIVRITDGEAMADSRDVAAYFGKNHFDVLRAIRNLDCSLAFTQRNFASFKIKDLTGENTSHVSMTRDGFTFLAMSFTGAKAAAYKEAYINAFNVMEAELRNRSPTAFLSDPAALRGLLSGYCEKVIALQDQVAELAPKAQALDLIETARGSLCITDTAKALQVSPKGLFAWLASHDWIYRHSAGQPYIGRQEKVKAGLLEHKTLRVVNADGSRLELQVRVTPRGVAALAKKFPFAVRPQALLSAS